MSVKREGLTATLQYAMKSFGENLTLRSRIFFLAILILPSLAMAQSPHLVLIFDAGEFTSPFRLEHAAAIRAELTKDSDQLIETYPEGLNLDRFPSHEYKQSLIQWLKNKYKNRKIDAIIAEGPEALDFSLEFRAELKQPIPVLFTLIADYYVKRMSLPPNVSGVAHVAPVSDWIKLAIHLFPNTKRVIALGDDSTQSANMVDVSRGLIEISLKQKVDMMFGMPIPDVLSRVGSLPDDAVIIYLGITTDGSGHYFLPEELVRAVARTANRPIFLGVNSYMGSGAIGGLIVKATDGAHEVAEMTRLVLNGKDAGTIPVLHMDFRKPVFDARALKKWDVSIDSLPSGSELRNYEPTLWEEYSHQIISIVVALILQAALIVALVFERRRRRRAELRFRRVMSDYAHLNRTTALGELSASFAHELNQPLAAILSNAEAAELLLDTNPPAIEEVKNALTDILRDNKRASDIISGMRSLFKKGDFSPTVFDVNKIIGEIIRYAKWEARSKQVTVATDLAEGILPVSADKTQLQQVIMNLLMNAIEATQHAESDTRLVTVTSLSSEPGRVMVSVTDNGSGIPDELIDHIFDPYYTTKAHGMGMGLSISRTIIELHGSRLWVRNNDGGGATFGFELKSEKSI